MCSVTAASSASLALTLPWSSCPVCAERLVLLRTRHGMGWGCVSKAHRGCPGALGLTRIAQWLRTLATGQSGPLALRAGGVEREARCCGGGHGDDVVMDLRCDLSVISRSQWGGRESGSLHTSRKPELWTACLVHSGQIYPTTRFPLCPGK